MERERTAADVPGSIMDGDPVLRVGIDLGTRSTVLQSGRGIGGLLVPRTHRLPSIVACELDEAGAPIEVLVGEAALAHRDELTPFNPLRCDDAAIRDGFADHIRGILDEGRTSEVWGVVGVPPGSTPDEIETLRLIANRIFDRTKFLDGAVLMATSYGSHDVARRSLWVDVGARAVRIAAVHGGATASEQTIVLSEGTDAVCRRLRDSLRSRFPDLPLTTITTQRLVKTFGFVAPARPSCRLRLRLDGAEQSIDIAPYIERACEPLVRSVLDGLRKALRECPSDAIEEFLQNIVLSGGGSGLQGLRERVRDHARRDFGEKAAVSVPDHSETLVANGALRWSYLLQEEDWEIPLLVGA